MGLFVISSITSNVFANSSQPSIILNDGESTGVVVRDCKSSEYGVFTVAMHEQIPSTAKHQDGGPFFSKVTGKCMPKVCLYQYTLKLSKSGTASEVILIPENQSLGTYTTRSAG